MNLQIARWGLAIAVLCGIAAHAEVPFDFFVVGCMPYGGDESHLAYLRLVDDLNAQHPAFTVHVGDTKSGSTLCNDAAYDRIASEFAAFQHPIFYSVGDNEWTDCDRPKCGAFDPLERLELVRKRFFLREESLGAIAAPLVSQRRMPEYARYVENTRWDRGGVEFVAVHVVGTNNNLRPEIPSAVAEYQARDAANTVWLRDSFADAQAKHAMAVVVLIQANPFDDQGGPRSDGFTNFVGVLREETLKWGRPVLLAHADTHYFRVDKPLRDAQGLMITAFTRLEVFGSENIHAVQIHVDPARPEDPFTIRPHLVAGNLRTPAAK